MFVLVQTLQDALHLNHPRAGAGTKINDLSKVTQGFGGRFGESTNVSKALSKAAFLLLVLFIFC